MEEQEGRYYEKLKKNYKLELLKLQKQIAVSYPASTYRNHRDVILPSIFPSV